MTTSFEIRVEGELAARTLHRLGCDHCLSGTHQMIRVRATPADLQDLLNVCERRGLTIESIVRVRPH